MYVCACVYVMFPHSNFIIIIIITIILSFPAMSLCFGGGVRVLGREWQQAGLLLLVVIE